MNKHTVPKIKIGVMGSASGPTLNNKAAVKKARELGQEIAKQDCILVNGACPGLPNEAAIGANEEDGFVLGISPAFSEEEHIHKYRSPQGEYDLIIYSGMGFMERDIINIRSSDAIVILGGGIGTLNEFTVAYDEGKVIGVLLGTGGISNHVPEILDMCDRELTPFLIFDGNPKKLIEKVRKAIADKKGSKSADERVTGPEELKFKKQG